MSHDADNNASFSTVYLQQCTVRLGLIHFNCRVGLAVSLLSLHSYEGNKLQ